MADDERDDPARPPSRGPRVVTGDMIQARAGRPGRGKTATGWAPTAPAPVDPAPADPAPDAAGEDMTAETLVGPAPSPPPAADKPRRPRVVTGGTPPAALPEHSPEPETPEPGETTEAMAPPPPPPARVVRPRPGPAPAWTEPEPDDQDAVIPPPVHRSAAPSAAGPMPYTPGQPGKPGKAPRAGGLSRDGSSEPLAKRALLLAVLSVPLTALVAIPALLVAGRANRRLAERPGTRGGGLVTAARVIAVLSLVGWLAVAGLVVASVVRPDGVDYAKLKPGDCIDTPEGTEVRRLTVRSCDDPHDAEVFAVVTHPAAADAPFPGTDDLLAYAANACLGQPFTDYIGIPRGQSQLTEFEIVPESEAWFEGRRGLVCAVDKADRTPLTGSVKGSAT
jgi:hypothetical protein